MSKLTELGDFNSTDPAEFMRFASRFLSQLQDLVNGQIDFGSNIRGQMVTASFSTANVDVAVSHSLGRTGLNYIVTQNNTGAALYHGSTNDSNGVIYLRASIPGTLSIFLF